jgi:hypothetical protein
MRANTPPTKLVLCKPKQMLRTLRRINRWIIALYFPASNRGTPFADNEWTSNLHYPLLLRKARDSNPQPVARQLLSRQSAIPIRIPSKRSEFSGLLRAIATFQVPVPYFAATEDTGLEPASLSATRFPDGTLSIRISSKREAFESGILNGSGSKLPRTTPALHERRVRDSNPGRFYPRQLSRLLHSSALPTLHARRFCL